MIKFRHFHRLALLWLALLSVKCYSQCVNTFPYFEDFEGGQGIWSSGGTNSSWAYGVVSKPVITAAASGQNCWTTGGLSGGTYNNSEHAFLESTCFDFTTLNYPAISLKIFWECEKKYDGGNLQSSIDGGATWVNVGAFGDPVDCNTDNWFNTSSITYLGSPAWVAVKQGWSGNIQPTGGSCSNGSGNGSGAWVLAKHCLTGLANNPSVKFRFTFGSGTICNAYDGIAIDDITISEGQANAPSFTYSCSGQTFSFTGVNPCSFPQSWVWDFGDPASGAANTANQASPSHTFSGTGTYTVTATLSGGACNPPGSISQAIHILDATISAQTPVLCNGGNDGTATVSVVDGNFPYTYLWSNGQTTTTANGLSAGNSSVDVTDNAGCSITLPVVIAEPQPITALAVSTGTGCGGTTGSATGSATGGTLPYSFSWNSTPVQTTATATNLPAGNYTVTITDANSCPAQSATTTVTTSGSFSIQISPASPLNICNGQATTLTALATGGQAPYTFTWSEGTVGNSLTVSPTATITYTVNATDAGGCPATPAAIDINVSPPIVFTISNDTAYCGLQPVTISAIPAAGQTPTFVWNPGNVAGNSISVSPIQTTSYSVVATDALGCVSSPQTVNVGVGQAPVVSFTAGMQTGCVPICITFTNTTPNSFNCMWDFGTGHLIAACDTVRQCYSTAGLYDVTLTASDAAGCVASQTALGIINLSSSPVADFFYSPTEITPDDPTVNFSDNSSAGVSQWLWNFGDANSTTSTLQNPSFNFSDTGCSIVTLMVMDNSGCSDSAIQQLCVEEPYAFYIPNAFTPTGNRKNEIFAPKGVGYALDGYEMLIFNRWGELVFRTKSLDEGWDGTTRNSTEIAKEDVYTYTVRIIDLKGKAHRYRGMVALIRRI